MKFKSLPKSTERSELKDIKLPNLTLMIKEAIRDMEGAKSIEKATYMLKTKAITKVDEHDMFLFTQTLCDMLDEQFSYMGLPINTNNLILQEQMKKDYNSKNTNYEEEVNELHNIVKDIASLDREQSVELIKSLRIEIDKIYQIIYAMGKYTWNFRFKKALELYALNAKSFLGRELGRLNEITPYDKSSTVKSIPQTADVYGDISKIEEAVNTKYVKDAGTLRLLDFVNDIRDLIASVEHKIQDYKEERDYISPMVESSEIELLNLKNVTGYLLMDLREGRITYHDEIDKVMHDTKEHIKESKKEWKEDTMRYVDNILEGIPTRQAFSELYNKLTNMMHELERVKEEFQNAGLFKRLFGKR